MENTPLHASMQRVLEITGGTFEEIAALLSVTVATVKRWAKSGISATMAGRLGEKLAVNPDWILTGEGEVSRQPKRSIQVKKVKKPKARPEFSPREAVLEFVQQEDGQLVLREVGEDEPLVSINFANKIKEMVGNEHLQAMGQHMLQAAIASFMHRQMSQYHAHVFDETPTHFS